MTSHREMAMQICRLVEQSIKPTTPTKAIADWLTSAVWLFGPDVGDVILQERLHWIKSSSLELATIGLQMDEFFPADNKESLDAILSSVAAAHPTLRTECEKVKAAFCEQFPKT